MTSTTATTATPLTKAQQARNLTGVQTGQALSELRSGLLIAKADVGRGRVYWPKSVYPTMDAAAAALKAAGLKSGLDFTQYRAAGGFDNLVEIIAAATTTTATTEDTTMTSEPTTPAIDRIETGAEATDEEREAYAALAAETAAKPAKKAKKAPVKKAAPAPAAPALDVIPALVEGLAKAGVKATLKWSPKGDYASLIADGKNIAYLGKQTRTGVKCQPALTTEDVAAADRGSFKPVGRAGANFGLVAMITEANLAEGVARIAAADSKRKAAVEAKKTEAAAKKAAAKTAAKKA